MSCDTVIDLERLAEFLLGEDKVDEAYLLFVDALRANPELKSRLKYSFTTVVCLLGRILESKGDYNELFACYEQALSVFSENEAIRTNLGAHLHRLGCLAEASDCFTQALRINGSYLRAKNHLENIYCSLVDRWHFRMLNDKYRNVAFRKAIITKVKSGHKHVLDIGSGTGILSLFAVKGGSTSVYACDQSRTMVEISQKVFVRNCGAGKVKLLHKHSNAVCIPDDIPDRVSLVITETVDAALFGENILQTLVHAWENLLLPSEGSSPRETINCARREEWGCVIPCSGELWIAAIECEYINMKYRLKKKPHRSSCDFLDDIDFDIFASDGEPYDTIDLLRIPGGYRLLSHPTVFMKVNFNDYEGLVKLLKGMLDKQTSINCTESGQVDAIAVWFTLYLDETISLSSAPFDVPNKAPCWDQAIFPLPRAVLVSSATELPLCVACKDGILKIHVLPSVVSSVPQNSYWSMLQNETIYSASPDVITFLNDRDCRRALKEVYALLSLSIRQASYDVLDLSPFPILGLSILRSHEASRGLPNQRLMCVVQETRDEIIIRAIAYENKIPEYLIECVKVDDLEERLDGSRKFDLIIMNPVESKGYLNDKHIQLLPLLSEHLKEGGNIIPKEIKICAVLTDSLWLREASMLLECDRVCGYDIAPFLNKYKSSEHLDALLDAVPYRRLAENTEFAVTFEELLCSVTEPHVAEKDVQLHFDGCISAIAYWFKVKYLPTSPEVSTRYSSSFARQSFILIDPQKEVHSGDKIRLKLLCHQGYINMIVNSVHNYEL